MKTFDKARILLEAAAGFSLFLFAAPVAASEGKIGMPQLNIHDFSPQLVWLGVVFIVLYLLMARLALPKVADVIDARNNKIESDLNAADQMKQKSDAAIASYEAALAKARLDAETLAKRTRLESVQAAQAARAKAEGEVAEKVKAAEAGIQTAQAQAMKNIGIMAEGTAAALIKALAGIEVPDQMVKTAVETAIRENR